MYAISFGLVIVALITLVVGVFQSGLTFIWASIGASVLSAIFLAIGVLQKKPVQPATAGAPYAPASTSAADTAVMQPQAAPAPVPVAAPTETLVEEAEEEEEFEEPEEEFEEAEEVAPPPPRPAARKAASKAAPASKRTPAKAAASKPAASKAAPKATPGGATVIAIPERGTYHVPGCRFVKGRRDTERMAKSAASGRGYSPCGICKP